MEPAHGAEAERSWNRGLWAAFAVVLSLQVWPLRDLGNSVEPYLGPLPLTIAWHLGGVSAFIVIYLLWMTKVWLPEAARSTLEPSGDEVGGS